MIRVPAAGGCRRGNRTGAGRSARRGSAAKRRPSRHSRWSAARSSVRSSVRTCSEAGSTRSLMSLAGIPIYIAFRFQFSFAVGAIVATLHDVLVTLAFLAFFQYDMTLNVIAAHPDGHRLLGERHHRHLRPRPREPALMRREIAERGHQPARQPDARTNHHHGRHGAPVGARAVPVRRRGARRVSRSR